MRTLARGLILLLLWGGAIAHAAAQEAAPQETPAPVSWDRPANIRDAAERIARIQRSKGAEGAIKFIDACYRTHGLASAYSAPFEGCIAQDYLLTKLLTRIYGRLPPETLTKLGAPTPELLAQSMGRRIVAAFSQYKVTAADAEAFKGEVDKHGLPVFLKIIFPQSADEVDARLKPDARDGETPAAPDGGASGTGSEPDTKDNGKN